MLTQLTACLFTLTYFLFQVVRHFNLFRGLQNGLWQSTPLKDSMRIPLGISSHEIVAQERLSATCPALSMYFTNCLDCFVLSLLLKEKIKFQREFWKTWNAYGWLLRNGSFTVLLIIFYLFIHSHPPFIHSFSDFLWSNITVLNCLKYKNMR